MEGLTPNEIAANIALFGVWIFVLAKVTVQRKDDSDELKFIKRMARHTLTATLIAAIVVAGGALIVTNR